MTEINERDVNKIYNIRYVQTPVDINAEWNKPVWEEIAPITLDQYMGTPPEHQPRTQVKLAWDENHIYVIFRVEDRYVRATATTHYEKVCMDSCVEFFFTPQTDVSRGYFNVETNCVGTILMRHQRAKMQDQQLLTRDDLEKIMLRTSLTQGRAIDPEIAEPTLWTIEYALPWGILESYTPVTAPAPGVKWRGNFYKCADKTSHPHWLTWSKIPLDTPDFHVPRYFGTLQFV